MLGHTSAGENNQREKRVVYKSAGERNQWIVELEIDPSTPNNLDRTDVADKRYAKFRCKEARVMSICHKETGDFTDSVCSNFDPNFIYTTGEIVRVLDYDSNTDNVCSRGIHFYLTREAAFFHAYERLDGRCKLWFKNGNKDTECTFKNGERCGKYKTWYENGYLREDYTYKNGKANGLCKTWHHDGDLRSEHIYNMGIIVD